MKIVLKGYLYESFSGSVKYITPKTTLFHGTGEEISGELSPGAYDDVLWFSTDSWISQTYIKCGLTTNVSAKELTTFTSNKESINNIRKQLGIEFRLKNVGAGGEITQYEIISPKEFIDISHNNIEINRKLTLINNRLKEISIKMNSNPIMSGDIDNISRDEYLKLEKELDLLSNEFDELDSTKTKLTPKDPAIVKREYVKNQLAKLGYSPNGFSDKWDDLYTLKIDDNDNILPNSHKETGKLYIAKPKRNLKLYDISTGDPDASDIQYHSIDLFRKLESQGYDGVIIDDFAQHNHSDYSIAHISYGIFKHAVNDLDYEVIDACHPDNVSKQSDDYLNNINKKD